MPNDGPADAGVTSDGARKTTEHAAIKEDNLFGARVFKIGLLRVRVKRTGFCDGKFLG